MIPPQEVFLASKKMASSSGRTSGGSSHIPVDGPPVHVPRTGVTFSTAEMEHLGFLLDTRLAPLHKEISGLRRDNRDLLQKNGAIIQDNKDLLQKNDAIIQDNARLRQDNVALHHRVESLHVAVKTLSTDVHILHDVIFGIKNKFLRALNICTLEQVDPINADGRLKAGETFMSMHKQYSAGTMTATEGAAFKGFIQQYQGQYQECSSPMRNFF